MVNEINFKWNIQWGWGWTIGCESVDGSRMKQSSNYLWRMEDPIKIASFWFI